MDRDDPACRIAVSGEGVVADMSPAAAGSKELVDKGRSA